MTGFARPLLSTTHDVYLLIYIVDCPLVVLDAVVYFSLIGIHMMHHRANYVKYNVVYKTIST